MLKFENYEIEKNGVCWIVSVPYFKDCPHFKQDEYSYELIAIVEEDKETVLEVQECLVSDNGEYINFLCVSSLADAKEEEEHIVSTLLTQIKREREAQGLTLMQLAEKASTSYSALSAIEAGKRNPSYDALVRIATALGKKIELV